MTAIDTIMLYTLCREDVTCVKLLGEHVDLRPLTYDDLTKRLVMVNDPDVQRQMTGVVGDETSEHSMYTWFKMYSEDPYSEQWAIVNKEGEYIGDIDLHSIGVLANEAWINPMFGTEEIRNSKTMRQDAIRLITDYAFQHKRVDTIHIDVPDIDTVSIEALKKLSFQQTDSYAADMFGEAKTLTFSLSSTNAAVLKK